MVKKILLLVLVGSLISAGGEKRHSLDGDSGKGLASKRFQGCDAELLRKHAQKQLRDAELKRKENELRRRVGDATSPLQAYARLMNPNNRSRISGSDVLGGAVSLFSVLLLLILIQ